MLASGALDRAVDQALAGPLVDALARDLVRHGVPERIAGELIAQGVVEEVLASDVTGQAALAALDAVLASPHTDEAVRRVLESGALDRALDQALAGPLVDAVVGTWSATACPSASRAS